MSSGCWRLERESAAAFSFRSKNWDQQYHRAKCPSRLRWRSERQFDGYLWNYARRLRGAFRDSNDQGLTANSRRDARVALWIKGHEDSPDRVHVRILSRDEMEVHKGRFISEIDFDNDDNVCVLSHELAEYLFPTKEAVGQALRVRSTPYRIIGVMKKARRDGGRWKFP